MKFNVKYLEGVIDMTLIKFEPLREFDSLHDRLMRMFNDFSYDTPAQFNPRIDISEDEKKIYVEAELPGMKKDDLKISIQDNILTISGEKKSESEEKKEKNYYRSERCYGSFQRSFTLPAEVNRDKTDAKFEDGILKINIEKSQPKEMNARTIQIK
jgi:HSP20 family protein